MKKATEFRTVKVFKRVFNVRRWSDLERVQEFFYAILHAVKILLIPQPKQVSAVKFEEAVDQFHLTNQDLAEKSKALFRWCILMLFFAGCAFLYGIYKLALHEYLAFGISCSVTGIAISFAFRYHFWFYQISHRRLGCSFKNWFVHGFLGRPS